MSVCYFAYVYFLILPGNTFFKLTMLEVGIYDEQVE